jgi:hypothetical protein
VVLGNAVSETEDKAEGFLFPSEGFHGNTFPLDPPRVSREGFTRQNLTVLVDLEESGLLAGYESPVAVFPH